MNPAEQLASTLGAWQQRALIAALAGGALCGLAAVLNLQQFLQSYLIGFLFWWSVTVGSLGLLMLYYLVGGKWGAAARPLLESGGLLTPVIALLFLPVVFGLEWLYPWTAPEFATQEKALYLNQPFFHGRAIAFFSLWTLLGLMLGAGKGTRQGEPPRWRRLASAGGLCLMTLTVTFAAIDWGMSLDPLWFSSIYGALVAMGGVLAAMALTAIVFGSLETHQPTGAGIIAPHTLGDLGTLLLAFLMLWAYFGFSQFLIIWSANLPEENVWYVIRLNNHWQWLGLAVLLLQFVLPFFLLLSRDMKQSPRGLSRIAALVFVMQFFYTLWTLSPTFHPAQLFIHWADLAAPVAVGGVWLTAYLALLRGRAVQMIAMNQS